MRILKLFMVCIVCFLISSCNRSVSEGNAVKYDIDTILNKSEPITINIWHYYSATQKENFDEDDDDEDDDDNMSDFVLPPFFQE